MPASFGTQTVVPLTGTTPSSGFFGNLLNSSIDAFERIRAIEFQKDLFKLQLLQQKTLNATGVDQNVGASPLTGTGTTGGNSQLVQGVLLLGGLILAAVIVKEVF